MFWKKKPPPETHEPVRSEPPAAPQPKTPTEKLNEAASTLAASLIAYSEAAYRASQPGPDAELQAAYDKVEAAHKLVTEGRIAYALGRCLPEHVKYWPSWIKQDDFENYVGFAATEIAATEEKEEDGSRNIKVKTIDFTFNDGHYRLILRDRGMSYAPDDPYRLGEVELFTEIERVAKLEIVEDISKEYSQWEFSEVRALKVGPWMQDLLDMATQIEVSRRRRMDEFQDERAREAARDIDLG
ncbi:hypothetical protein ILP92_17825 [Maribius pontilimi]|uniref:Uncharacterized protein n=1 Tax=Palleronia pontilimi TaxID=1964209 RepID=A0A934ME40_9RHOB|nr:hypothetical protein [Palleronia pontilimi]MBJ3764598.1 hypothetical protein [Palleronia pontilimi]